MKNLFEISLKNELRKKSTIINIILVSLVFIFVFFLNSYLKTSVNHLENDILDARFILELTITGTTDPKYKWETRDDVNKLKEDLLKIDHVTYIANSYAYWTSNISDDLKVTGLDGTVEYYAANNKSLPEIVYGTNFPDEDGDYMVCPENFYPSAKLYSEERFIPSTKKINIKDFLNKKITIKYDSRGGTKHYTRDFTIVGFYKNNPTHIDESTCYIPDESFKRMAEEEYIDDIDPVSGIHNIEIQTILILKIDDVKNLDYVKSELDKRGVSYSKIYDIVYSIFENTEKNVNRYTKILLVVLFIILLVIFKIKFEEDIKSYKLLSYLGYTKKEIITVNCFSILIQFVLATIVSIIILLLILPLTNLVFDYYPFILDKWRFIPDYNSIVILAIVMLLCIIMCVSYSVYRLKADFDENNNI